MSPALLAAAKTPGELARDHHRPKYHFLPPANWMNDPVGPIYWRGRYHMFYQHNPRGAYWSEMHWGHAVSLDMIHWRHLPVALAPQREGYDDDGVWAGSIVVNDGVPTIVYTGVQPEVQCLATSRSDDLRIWRRHEGNPVLTKPPEGMHVTGFRDPFVWQQDGAWMMALGSGEKDVGGCVLLYSSPDLEHWTYVGRLFEGPMPEHPTGRAPVSRGEMWETPCFFPVGKKHILSVSTRGTTPVWVGEFDGRRFIPEYETRLDTGAYYAPTAQLDSRGRRIVWGWIQERRSESAQREAGWSGVLSLPRVVTLNAEGRITFSPAPQVRALRGSRMQFAGMFIADGRPEALPGLAGDALHLIVRMEPQDSEECGVQVLRAVDGSEAASISYNQRLRRLSVGQAFAEQNGNLELRRGELLHLEVFLDCSVIEVFANGRACVTGRVYAAKPDSTGVALVARGGTAQLQSLLAFEMKPISPDRLTS
jgi:beta-fructofuranosidase